LLVVDILGNDGDTEEIAQHLGAAIMSLT